MSNEAVEKLAEGRANTFYEIARPFPIERSFDSTIVGTNSWSWRFGFFQTEFSTTATFKVSGLAPLYAQGPEDRAVAPCLGFVFQPSFWPSQDLFILKIFEVVNEL